MPDLWTLLQGGTRWQERDKYWDLNPIASAEVYPHPLGAPVANGWGVTVNGQNTWVHTTPWGGFDTQRMATYSTDALGVVEIVVTVPIALTSVAVKPTALNIVANVTGNTASFTVPSGFNGHLVVEFNGTNTDQLQISAMPPEPAVNPASYTRYYGPGYHPNVGEIVLTSGQSLYVAGGALVEGKVRIGPNSRGGVPAVGCSVSGRGIIDSAAYLPLDSTKFGRPVRAQKAIDSTLTGVTFIGMRHWGVVNYECDNVTYSWLRIFNKRVLVGAADEGTPDGFDCVGSSDITLRNSFIRAYDDAIAVKCMDTTSTAWYGNTTNALFEDNVIVQGDGGNSHEIGYEIGPWTVDGVIFRRNTIVRKTSRIGDTYRRAAIGLHKSDPGGGTVTNILWEDITVESDMENHMWIGHYAPADMTVTGTISNLTLRRVKWPSNTLPFVMGYTQASTGNASAGVISGVTFEDCYKGATKITSTSGMTINGNTSGVTFI